MSKIIKILIKLFVIAAIVFLAVYFFYYFKGDSVALSQSQEEMVKSLGRPEQFAITYMPKGSDEGSDFVRHETWFYPSLGSKLTFLAGELVLTEELEIPEGKEYYPTIYNSEDFNFYTNLTETRELLGEQALEPLELPGFFDEGVEVYGSAGAMFVFEEGNMTYMETLD